MTFSLTLDASVCTQPPGFAHRTGTGGVRASAPDSRYSGSVFLMAFAQLPGCFGNLPEMFEGLARAWFYPAARGSGLRSPLTSLVTAGCLTIGRTVSAAVAVSSPRGDDCLPEPLVSSTTRVLQARPIRLGTVSGPRPEYLDHGLLFTITPSGSWEMCNLPASRRALPSPATQIAFPCQFRPPRCSC